MAPGMFLIGIGRHRGSDDVSGQWDNEWPLDTWVDSPIFRWLRDTLLPILVKEPAEYPEPDEDKSSNEVLLHEPESNQCALPSAPPPQMAVLFCPLPGQVRHLK